MVPGGGIGGSRLPGGLRSVARSGSVSQRRLPSTDTVKTNVRCTRAGKFSSMYTSNRPSRSAAFRNCRYSSDVCCFTLGTIWSTGVAPYVSYFRSADTSDVRLMKFFAISVSMP
uniref:Uncharacterized protein n=1 Tax=Anopheles atroparvus TaxID=41427 RepID=A0A182J431_ANOAO